MKVKVCGIKYPDNLARLSSLDISMIGFNFYPPSKRFVTENSFTHTDLALLPKSISRVGVFVNAELEFVKQQHAHFGLDYLQLHGDEDVTFMQKAQEIVPVIKVFRITEDFDFRSTVEFEKAGLFLFDTFTKAYGGSGERFDWNKLDEYEGETPFLLAGGIQVADSSDLSKITHPKFIGIDINSGFELEPGLKDPDMITEFLENLKEKI